jgi:hypothetical protein
VDLVKCGFRPQHSGDEFHASPFPGVVSICVVDAGGVPAEWVETTAATNGQPTFLHFSSGKSGADALAAGRQSARGLAVGTDARIFSVGCQAALDDPPSVAIEDGVTAYAWLLEEGLDLPTTTFTDTGDGLATAVLWAAKARGFPIPPAEVA